MSTLTPVLLKEKFVVTGKVELFPQKGGWHFVRVSKKLTEQTKGYADRGLVAITVTVGNSTWKTSLLPMGDGTQFIALPAKVRNQENIAVNDTIKLSFVLRER